MKLDSIKTDINFGDLDRNEMGIDSEDMGFILDLLSNKLYSDKISAVIREYSCNAVDAHIEAGKDDLPISVTLPTLFSPQFVVQDFGYGLSRDSIVNLFLRYGKSNKRDSNEQTGAFGLGCKSGFAYSDAFNVTSVNNGTRTFYTIQKDGSGKGQCITVGSEETEDPSGLTITIPIENCDINEFVRKARDIYSFFSVKPDVTNTTFGHTEYDKSISDDGWFLSNDLRGRPMVVMGNVSYALDLSHFDESYSFLSKGVVLTFDLGRLDIPPSRETVEYTQKSLLAIKAKIKTVKDSFEAKTLESIKRAETYGEAVEIYRQANKVVNLPREDLKWNEFPLVLTIEKFALGWNHCGENEKEPKQKHLIYDALNPAHYALRRKNYMSRESAMSLKVNEKEGEGIPWIIDDVDGKLIGKRLRLAFGQTRQYTIAVIKQENIDKAKADGLICVDWDLPKLSSFVPEKASRESYGSGNKRTRVKLFYFDIESSPNASGTDMWKDFDHADLDEETHIYVPICRYSMPNFDKSDTHKICRLALHKFGVKIFGVRTSDVEKLDETFMSIGDYLRENWQDIYTQERINIDELRKFGLRSFFKFSKERHKEIFKASDFLASYGAYYELVNEACHKSRNNDLMVLANMLGMTSKEINWSEPAIKEKELIEIDKELAKKYPLLARLEEESNDYCFQALTNEQFDDMISYIKGKEEQRDTNPIGVTV